MTEESRELTPAEQRLVGLLLLLREERGHDHPGLTGRVMRAVRLQYVTRGFVRAIGSLAAAIGDALALLLGARGGSPRR